MGEAQPEKASSSWGDGLEIFNDLLLLARRINTAGSSEAKMFVQHVDDVIEYPMGGTRDELAQLRTNNGTLEEYLPATIVQSDGMVKCTRYAEEVLK